MTAKRHQQAPSTKHTQTQTVTKQRMLAICFPNKQTNQPKQTKKHHKHTSLPQSHSQRGHCQEGGEWKCTQIRQDTLKHKHTPAQARQVQRKGKKKKRGGGEGANLKGTRNNNNNNNNNNLNSNNNLNNNLNDNNLNNNNLNNN